MSALQSLLDTYRSTSVTEREKGTYFEELICAYLRNEATYRDLYDKVWMYADWAKEQGLDGRDTGIDLVARKRLFHHFEYGSLAIAPRAEQADDDAGWIATLGYRLGNPRGE